MTTGIYAIISPSGRQYIGQSDFIESRFEKHKHNLMRGTHDCVALQHEWNTYKPHWSHMWLWMILEAVDNDFASLTDLEQHYINTSNVPLFNTRGVLK